MKRTKKSDEFVLPQMIGAGASLPFDLKTVANENDPEKLRRMLYRVSAKYVKEHRKAKNKGNQAQRAKRRANKFEEALRLAHIDATTGLPNRDYGDQHQTRIHARGPYGLMIIDLDHFKKANDTYGHATGDSVLFRVARILESSLREGDIACRHGQGDEFMIIFRNLDDLKTLADRAEGIRKTIENKAALPIENNASLYGVTASIGVAIARGTRNPSAFKMRDYADKAVYESKTTKNMVSVYDAGQVYNYFENLQRPDTESPSGPSLDGPSVKQ